MTGFAADMAVDAVTQGLATAVETDLFIGTKAKIPSKPENVGPYTSLIETGGTTAMLAHDQRYAQPSLQIVVRAASASIARAKAQLWHARYCALFNVTLNGTKYERIVAVQEVLDMQSDEVGRARFGFNVNAKQTQ